MSTINPMDWLPLAAKYANQYKSFSNWQHDFADLLHTAMIGVLIACKKFDSERGYTFQACASVYIRKELQSLLFADYASRTLRFKEVGLTDGEIGLLYSDSDASELCGMFDRTSLDLYNNRSGDSIIDSLYVSEVVSSLTEEERKYFHYLFEYADSGFPDAEASRYYRTTHKVSRVTELKYRNLLKDKLKAIIGGQDD